MKKRMIMLLSTLVNFAFIGSVYAADDLAVAKLHMKITSKINDKIYALCVSDTCYPLVGKGKLIPIEASKVSSIIMTNMTNMTMYAQKLPTSCQITVNKDKTLVVSGHLVEKRDGVVLENLRCAVND